MTDTLMDLIERVERAEGPDRELDADIALTQGWQELPGDNWLGPEAQIAVPDYTASMDAARKLIPAGAPWSVNDYTAPKVAARVYGYHEGFGATPALALVAASLRAHMGTGR